MILKAEERNKNFGSQRLITLISLSVCSNPCYMESGKIWGAMALLARLVSQTQILDLNPNMKQMVRHI